MLAVSLLFKKVIYVIYKVKYHTIYIVNIIIR